MANFSKLPNEIVSEIWGYMLEPRDVESFAMVSKHVYAVGEPFVEEHNKLKRDFSFFHMNCWIRASTPAFLLKEVLLHPRVALYVSHLSIGPCLARWQDQEDVDERDSYDGWPSNRHVPYPDDIMVLFVEEIRKSCILPLDKDFNWIRSVKAGDEDPILALLLLHLPNLTTLSIMDEAVDGELFEETIHLFVFSTYLMHLTKINIGYFDLTRWNTFADLPSVQLLHVANMAIKVADDLIDRTQFLIPLDYSLTGLTFTRAALLAPSQTLSPKKNEEQTLGTFREFRALKEPEITLRLLLPRWAWWELTDLLPASIEKFYLHTPDDVGYKEVAELIENIARAKSQDAIKLRELKVITGDDGIEPIRDCGSLIEHLEESCRKVGIELTFCWIV